MLPISRELGAPPTAVTASIAITLWAHPAAPLRRLVVLTSDLEVIK
jgi:hypothetical protein